MGEEVENGEGKGCVRKTFGRCVDWREMNDLGGSVGGLSSTAGGTSGIDSPRVCRGVARKGGEHTLCVWLVAASCS